MSRIQLLSDEVASQVAAGEVVERPASVVKELVENSIDAGATRIEVRLDRGGIALIRVIDNGSGMDKDDALLALERHATSKIRTGHDLATVATLGFRGEALPSISSVSRFTLTTREHDAVSGTEVKVAGGKIETVRDGGEAPGTQIEVRSLFYNLPARRKFLRTEATEASHVEHQLQLIALGHPEVGLSYVKNGRLSYQLPPVATLAERVSDLFGKAFLEDLIAVHDAGVAGITLSGFIAKPGVTRASRAQQQVFVNGRPVENSAIRQGLREGYHTALPRGQHPVTVLFLQVDPQTVDVNVHPAKREVRFRFHNRVRDAVAASVRLTLEDARAEWASRIVTPQHEPFDPPAQDAVDLEQSSVPESVTSAPSPLPAMVAPVPVASSPTLPLAEPEASARPVASESAASGDFEVIATLGDQYLVLESPSGLVLLEKRAAHQRILFEQMRSQMDADGVHGQRLLMPPVIELQPRDADWVRRNLSVLQRMGIGLEEFGSTSFKLDCLPNCLSADDPERVLLDIIDELQSATPATSRMRLAEELIVQTVCRYAVRGSDDLSAAEQTRLIEDLLACDLPYCDPRGRPTMVEFSYSELRRKFGRK